MAIYKSDIVDINLESGSIHRSFLKHAIGTADQAADRFGIRAFRDGQPVDLSGASCYGYFRNSHGTNIALTSNGTVSGNVAYVTLPQACYNYEGNFTLAVKLLVSGVTSTVRIIDGMVDNTNTGSAVAPTSAVPTYSEILSQYDAMVAATAVANGAIATTFNAATVYPAGSYVINDGALYLITADHAANVTWANTSKVATNLGAEVTALKSAFNSISELVNLVDFQTQTVGSVTLTKNADGTYTVNGTASSNTSFTGFTIPAGTYKAKIDILSPSSDGSIVGVRYGSGSGSNWTTSAETEKTFNAEENIFLRVNAGTYTNYKLNITIVETGNEYNAVDQKARNSINGLSEDIEDLSEDVGEINDSISDLTDNYGELAQKMDSITEVDNKFNAQTDTVSNVTLTKNADGTYTVNGTASSNISFTGFSLPAGTYKASIIQHISGEATGIVGIRYAANGSDSFWTSEAETEKTFNDETTVYVRVNSGTYTNYKLKFVILDSNSEGFTAIDYTARETGSENKETIKGLAKSENLFYVADDSTKNVTLANVDDTIVLNGTGSSNTSYAKQTLKPGTYTARITIISGKGNTVGLRYNDGTDHNWTIGNNTFVTLTFDQPVQVNLRANSGTYESYVFKVLILPASSNFMNLAHPCNMLGKYNVFTCVDKSSIKLSENTSILAFGDSITHGGEWGDSWLAKLQNHIGNTVVNKAVTGALFGESVRTSNYWISTQLSGVSVSEWSGTNLVVIAAGTNDARYDTTMSELATKVASAISTIKSNTNAPILFITPIKRGASDDEVAFNKLPEISGIIEHIALTNGCSVIAGLNFPIPSHDQGQISCLMESAIHPNNLGAEIYAMSVINAIM